MKIPISISASHYCSQTPAPFYHLVSALGFRFVPCKIALEDRSETATIGRECLRYNISKAQSKLTIFKGSKIAAKSAI